MLFALSLGGCDGSGGPERRAAASAPKVPAAFVASTHRAICTEGDALPTPTALDALGPPVEQARFTLAEPIPEFRVKLLNRFRLPRDAAAVIWERGWASGDCRLTVWSARGSGGWRPVERLHWSAGDGF